MDMIQGAKNHFKLLLENSSATESQSHSIPSLKCGTNRSVDCDLCIFCQDHLPAILHLGKSITYGVLFFVVFFVVVVVNFKYYCLNVS